MPDKAMLMLARVLILTAGTVALWLGVVRWHEAGRRDDGCDVSYVYDGDTVALDCGAREVTARVVGLDTPETRDAKCDAELAAGKAATRRLREVLKGAQVVYHKRGIDKYGRWLITLSANGRDVADILVGEGLAVPYRGGGRISWCTRLGAA